jgi:NADH-quinone oxidoreductase subunit C
MLNEIAAFLNNEVPSANASAHEVEVGTGHVSVAPESIFPVCEKLKNSDQFEMNVLQVISGVDYTDRIEVNYMLASFTKNSEVMIKVALPKKGKDELVEIDSVVSLWSAANFQERETFDMLGVSFKGHPDLRRILCPEDWKGYPLRKDYVVEEVYNGMVVNPEHKTNSGDHFFFKEMQQKYDAKSISFSWKGSSDSSEEDASDA